MPLQIVRDDITKMKVDTIVNAANPQLKKGGGVCGAIFQAAGAKELQKACDEIGGCSIGQAVITDGFRLYAKHIIHTPGPIWRGGKYNEAAQLAACYFNSLHLAKDYQLHSIAIPLISTGIFGYPKDEALNIAVSTISEFLLVHEMDVYLVVFDKQSFHLSKKLFHSIHEYIDEHFVKDAGLKGNRREEAFILETLQEESIRSDYAIEKDRPLEGTSLVEYLNMLDETFSMRLLRMIDERRMTDVEAYTRANISRKLFSKIRTNHDYQPKKKTALAFAIALELSVAETNELLQSAGYTLSHSSKFDVIIEYFIIQRNFNIHEINEALFAFDQPLLGG
ncbi:macro domain-containing protein [Metabacillus malikii]|uniref:O-acetyl-ADP-ribose deacetylase (Regulator of RNase III) n=1 Tax=Metabacillus malikii TaxID=1504265 RepID=A0ABT9Z9R5_9BACI|nr:macro domain-containing protein [Metabacillus malikii]MDQ0229001.1 O-acetyl-ADP-ribose deacetylase (regulator of RNase III) [Metabacillus malikii]